MSAAPERPACDAFRPRSPENAACAWCARFRINLDPAGGLCARCGAEPAFREQLARHAAVRLGPDCREPRTWCERFATATTDAQCERCRRDGAFRAFLHGQALARADGTAPPRGTAPPPPLPPCPNRGATLRTETRPCCGGRTRRVPLRACARRGTATAADCRACGGAASGVSVCPDPPHPPERERRATGC